jgi:hypothetical protein
MHGTTVKKILLVPLWATWNILSVPLWATWNILPVPLWATCNPQCSGRRYTQFALSKCYTGPSYSGACISIFTINTAHNVNRTYMKCLELLKFLFFFCSLCAPSTHNMEAGGFFERRYPPVYQATASPPTKLQSWHLPMPSLVLPDHSLLSLLHFVSERPAVSNWDSSSKTRRSSVSPCGIWGGQVTPGQWDRFLYLSFLCHYHPTNIPYAFISPGNYITLVTDSVVKQNVSTNALFSPSW